MTFNQMRGTRFDNTGVRARRRVLARLTTSAGVAVAAALTFAAAAPAAAPYTFSSPSKNIRCQIFPTGYGPVAQARCDITSRTYQTPKRPANCEFDYGNAFVVRENDRRGQIACASDTVSPGRTLAYGRSVSRYGFTCHSMTTGVRCVNQNGHGFRVRRAEYKLF